MDKRSAGKYCEKLHGTHTVRRADSDRGAENPIYTEIIVRDNGTGIQKEDLPHLFERFYRGKGTENTGVGIGLSLAAEIVRRQNGTIKVFNAKNGGAEFQICFYKMLP